MKNRGLLHTLRGLAIAAVLLMGAAGAGATSKTIMVHYMPWFEGPYAFGSGNWGNHWTGAIYSYTQYFNPNQTNSAGQDMIASHYYPLIGPYDCLDPVVSEYHVVLMKLAGIDGVLADWDGNNVFDDFLQINSRMAALYTNVCNAGLKFGVVVEPWTMQAQFTNNIAAATASEQGQMLYLQTNYFNTPNYLRLGGKPVLLDFGNAYFTSSSQWTSIFSVLDATNQPAFFTEDNALTPAAEGAFDWPPMSQSSPSGGSNVLSNTTLVNYLNNFRQNGNSWSAYVSSAFPRYNDIYAQIGGVSNGYLSDNNGVTFQETLSMAMTNASSVVQLVTWNDYGEGTVIEPTAQYGYRDLGVVQNYRRQYIDPSFPYHTNDLALALQLYNLRRQYGNYPVVNAELNRVFTNLVSGNLAGAQTQMAGVQAGKPVLYSQTFTNGQIQFCLGGYLVFGATVQKANNLSGPWQTVTTYSPNTFLQTFSTNISAQPNGTYFRVSQ